MIIYNNRENTRNENQLFFYEQKYFNRLALYVKMKKRKTIYFFFSQDRYSFITQ